MFNKDSLKEIQDKLSSYISMFSYEDSVTHKIPVHLISNSSIEFYIIYEDHNINIRDIEESVNKELFRKLIFKDKYNEIKSEVKLKLTSKRKAKEENSPFLPTADKFAKNHVAAFLNAEYNCNFLSEIYLSGFFLTKNKIPEEKLKVLILWAVIG